MSWLIQTDGGSRGNPGPAALGVTIMRDGKEVVGYGEFLGTATNNVAEYTAVLRALEKFSELAPDGESVEIRADSKLVVEQLSGRWKIKNAELKVIARQVKAAFPADRVRYTWVPRAQNKRADELANKAMDRKGTVEEETAAAPVETASQVPEERETRVVVVQAPATDTTLRILDRLRVGSDSRFLPVAIAHRSDATSHEAAIRISRHISGGAAASEASSAELKGALKAASEGGTRIVVTDDAAPVLSAVVRTGVSVKSAAGSVSIVDISGKERVVRALGVFV